MTSSTRPAWVLVLLALAQLIYALDLNIVFVALPEIGADLGFSGQTQQWVVSAYVVFAGGFLLLGGRAADLLGRRRVFVLALVLYALSSLAGGLATGQLMIVVARAVQGIGGALLLPATLALIGTLFPEGRERNRAFAVWGGAGASGLTVGALLGGVLTQAFGWSAVFFVNVPLAGLVAVAAPAVVPADPPRATGRRFDLPGALTATAGATLLVFALVQGPDAGWTSPGVVLAAALAVVLLGVFAVVEARGADPLLPPSLLRNRALLTGIGVTALYMATFGTLPYFLTVLFQTVRGMSALQTGLAFLVPSLAIAAGTQLGERLTGRFGARTTLVAGFGVGAVGTVVLAVGFGGGYGAVVPGLVVSGVGQGVTWTAMWITAATGVAPEEQGVANGMASTTLNLGNAVGLAVLIAFAGASGSRAAVLVAAAGMAVGAVLVAFARTAPRRTARDGDAGRPLNRRARVR
ncbi:MFS transporter [Amycolatopsis sacchari]|uniref:MFS transporter n=1 Tax=Amycolatopsis sacchari TaxID=115433 RepID=UPI003D7096E7